MMDGYKGKLFELYVSFIGWALLCCLPVGISFLWVLPYIRSAGLNLFESSLSGITASFMLILNAIGWVLVCSLLAGIGSLMLGLYIRASVTNFYEELKKHNAAAVQKANTEAVAETEAAYNNEEKKASQSESMKSAPKTSVKSTNDSRKKLTVNAFTNGIYEEDAEFQYSEVDGRLLARDKATKSTYYVLKENNWVKINRN
jgi:hypothetical protein